VPITVRPASLEQAILDASTCEADQNNTGAFYEYSSPFKCSAFGGPPFKPKASFVWQGVTAETNNLQPVTGNPFTNPGSIAWYSAASRR
jgi:hypothetical protein